ncbi:MAG: SdrD B-like domain-containing protein [Gammaproteobacteria bacterium]
MESSRPGVGQQSDLNLPRVTYLKVDITNRNERIDVYTSATDNVAPGGAPMDIALWCPNNAPDEGFLGEPDLSGHASDYLSADATINVTNNGAGHITNWSEVVAVQNASTRPRAPATFNIRNICGGATGTYTLRLYGGCCTFSQPVVEFFDVMVRRRASSLRRGRVWTNHLALLARDGFGGELQTELFVVAGTDNGNSYTGHLWNVDANGIRPFGFHFFANDSGAEPDQNQDMSVRNTASPTPIMRPQYPIYFNRPNKPVINPPSPSLSGFEFTQSCNGATPSGGDFTFASSLPLDYQLAIDENGDGTYQVSEVILTGTAVAGSNTVNWNGLFADGTPVPQGTTADLRLSIESGEVHLPFYDVENQGSPTGPLITHATQNTGSRALYYWDDRPVGGTASPTDGTLTPHTWGNAEGNVSIIDTWKLSELLTAFSTTVYGETCTAEGGVEGTVFEDADHNGQLDSGEPGIAGITVVLQDLGSGICLETTTNVDGEYAFSSVAPGSYEVVEAAQESGACPPLGSDPSAYVSTTTNRIPVSVAQSVIPNQNFGDFNGARLRGRIFEDNGAGSGTAHDGLVNGAEIGFPGLDVTAESTPGGSIVDSTQSAGDGSFVVWIPASATGATIRAQNASGTASVSSDVGSTGGGNPGGDLDAVQLSVVPGTEYQGVSFGDVRLPGFVPENTRTIGPGAVVFYPHTFTATTTGSVTFSLENPVATPDIAGWSGVVLEDSNCNGVAETGEAVLTGALPVDVDTANAICILVKIASPAGAPIGAQYKISAQADFQYSGAPIINTEIQRDDLTLIAAPADIGLALQKAVDRATALPGATLTYTLTYQNNGTDPLSDIVIIDTTPAFTTFFSASCTAPLPASISGCATTTEPAVGASGPIEWTLDGSLDSNASGSIEFQVIVDQ